ncbi:MAG: alkaline phosphatase family protein [Planctomycetota bacterium]|jgi:predicted AlkP superfamily phosphohydrolase/phosphomutase
MARRLLLIGLDGATFDLIGPDLPNLTRLMHQGIWSPLRSTLPPMTFPAWSTFMTGVNPGKHGIFDFTRRLPNRYALQFVNATHRRRPSLWQLLSEAGLRVGVMGLPTTYPPQPVNGFLISGFDSPVTTSIDPSFVYPRGLYDELRQALGSYRITGFQELHIGPGWHRAALDSLQEVLVLKQRTAEYLLGKEPWDCFMVLFGESDTVGHHFWAFHDPDSPRHDVAGAREFSTAISMIYRQLDQAVGSLIAAAGNDVNVIVLSDHGFGGSSDKIICLNCWLAQNGYLTFRQTHGFGNWGVTVAKRLGLRLFPPWFQEQIFRRSEGRLASILESQTRFGTIDWSSTQAYSEESNSLPAIWINVRGRDPEGIVAPGDEYETVRTEIIAALAEFRDPDTGQPIVAQAHRREAVYWGPFMDQAPDIILELNLDRGYSYTCMSSQGQPGPSLRRLSPSEHLGAKGGSMNGSHRSEGILIMAGPDISGQLVNPALVDLSPTILGLLDVAVPPDLDGHSLLDRPISIEATASNLPDPVAYSPEAAAVLHNRLRELGYLE